MKILILYKIKIMENFWTNFWVSIGDFFTHIFEFMPLVGNKMNYLYMLIIFLFLVGWTLVMLQHKKNNES